MAVWHRSWKADIGLRLLGLVGCGVAWAALSHLFAMRPPARSPGVFAYALAAIGFVSASAGAALTLLGHHLFDEIEVSSRWRRGSVGDAGFAADLFLAQAAARGGQVRRGDVPSSTGSGEWR
jgi:hypothetical protein